MMDSARGDVVRVDFRFKRELAEKVEGNLASFCYQCGACVGDCPSATYGESFNPREIMLKVLYGLGEELLRENSVLWQCTNCYSCHERCPQEVKPVEVIISLKNMLADRGLVSEPVGRVIKAFESSGRTAPLNPAVERMRDQLGLPPLAAVPMDEIAALLKGESTVEGRASDAATASRRAAAEPLVPEPGARTPAQRAELVRAAVAGAAVGARDRESPAKEVATRRFAFFPGCLIPTRHPAMEKAIRSTLGKLGIDIVDLPGASCCPDPIYFKSKDKLSWLAVAARNLTLAEEMGLDIFTNCSGCTATLSETRHLLENQTLRAKVNARLARIGRSYRGTTRIRHIATLVRDVAGYEAVRDTVVRPLTGLKVAIHYGCHLLKPSRIMQVDDPNNPTVLESLVRALGAEPVRHRNWYLCCGKACQTETIPSAMMHDLLTAVHEEKADLLCLICPTCFGQFDHGQMKVAQAFGESFQTPPVYFFQLLAFAQGVPYEELGLERQRFKPEVLKRF
jgi:heterodisulfide reductase subunit B